MVRLGVNIDHVATVRQARKAPDPDPVHAALLAEMGGADCITLHLREDRRHVQDRDLALLRKTVKGKLNLEMAATQEMVKIALEVKPDQVTLVPERREELTTEGGLEVSMNQDYLRKVVRLLRDGDMAVSLFIDPEVDQVKAAHRAEADAVEIHTGKYCEARRARDRDAEFTRVENAARLSSRLGLAVLAGHGLTYGNVRRITAIPEVAEVNIGHSIVARAVLVGMERAVAEMRRAMEGVP
jgi:pyridoxine 5-phosphate synthase